MEKPGWKRVTLPAHRAPLLPTLLVAIIVAGTSSAAATEHLTVPLVLPDSPSDETALKAALEWLVSHQQSDGSYGDYLEGQASPAALALYLNNSDSQPALLAYSWLAAQLDDPLAWFWPSFGEADVPGEVLYSLAVSGQLSLIRDLQGVVSRLHTFHQTSGGFTGYYDGTLGHNVESSIDTAFALWGLTAAGSSTSSIRASSVDYLLSLQNSDGSFNLTSTISSDPLYGLGPDSVSITAAVVLSLREQCYTSRDLPVAEALEFLTLAVSQDFNGQVYAAAMSSLAFTSFGLSEEASRAREFIMSNQTSDGGFSDTSRLSYPSSNALDTGWAAIALQVDAPLHVPKCTPLAKFTLGSQDPRVGTSISFDGRDSYDPNGDLLSYTWTFGDGANTTGVEATHTYGRSGDFTVTLTVAEAGDSYPALSDTTWLTVTVAAQEQVAGAPSEPVPVVWFVLGAAVVGAVILAVVFLLRRKTASLTEA